MVYLDGLPINKKIGTCDKCHIGMAKGLGVGNCNATVLLLAQHPGNTYSWNPTLIPFELHRWAENKQVKSPDILKKVLEQAQIPLDLFYVTNVQKCAGLLKPEYIEKCHDWLEQELQLLPKCRLIVAMGRAAADRIQARVRKISVYQSDRQTFLTSAVSHPAAPLYPGGITRENYRKQWIFIGELYREVASYSTNEFHALCKDIAT